MALGGSVLWSEAVFMAILDNDVSPVQTKDLCAVDLAAMGREVYLMRMKPHTRKHTMNLTLN